MELDSGLSQSPINKSLSFYIILFKVAKSIGIK